tara:strand:- start:494 stop:721 length:228 start_codon:yes stop_codon:yes gene_type:complete
MKTMTCKQLGGPESCKEEFQAQTFEEMANLSKNHGMQQRNDPEHQKAMKAMMQLMQDPKAMQDWMEEKKKEFEAL